MRICREKPFFRAKEHFNPVRAEYSQMLKKQLAQGNNGLTKTKYLTFGIEAESMRQVKQRLNHIENDLLNNFRRLGVIATTMNGKERLHLMHSMFHIYYSTSLDATRKFKNFFLSGLAVQRLSDMVCLEHGLSIITPKPYRERQKRTVYPKKRTQRDELCDAIDAVLKQKPKSFDGFVQALADMGFEFKDGKQPAFKGENQKRFIRLRSLGEGYSKEEIQAVISGKNLNKSKGRSAKAPAPKQFQMLIDIQAKMAEGKTVGYEKWAKKFNRKEAARTVILLKEKGLGNYDDLTAHIENLSARFDALSDSIKVAEKRMVEVQALQQHIKNYRNTRQIYIEYRKSGYSKKFFEEHRQEITIHKAAKRFRI